MLPGLPSKTFPTITQLLLFTHFPLLVVLVDGLCCFLNINKIMSVDKAMKITMQMKKKKVMKRVNKKEIKVLFSQSYCKYTSRRKKFLVLLHNHSSAKAPSVALTQKRKVHCRTCCIEILARFL